MYKVEVGDAVKNLINDVVTLKKNGDDIGVLNRLEGICKNSGAIADSLSHIETDEELLYIDDEVSVFYLATTPNIIYPPHEHGMEAISAIYKGSETHIFYDREGDNVVERSKVRFKAPAVVDMTVQTVHAIVNEDDEPNENIHFYFGNLESQKRTLWDMDGKNPQQYIQEDYDNFARNINNYL
ncbi:MAG: hypothetical protein P8H03_07250 [Emcibacteraceae bacterium]|nr:hypothetical protein [Emcibacteraceae bacterium]MDG1858758.1 hypothetical protein [Emcibacteraceae bacterium]